MGSTAEILANKHYPLYYVAIHENDDPQPVIVCLSVCARASLLFSKSVQFDPSGTKVFFLLFGWWDFFFIFFFLFRGKKLFYILYCYCNDAIHPLRMLATRKSQPTHLDTQLYMHARREYVCWSVPLVCVCVIFGRMSRREA